MVEAYVGEAEDIGNAVVGGKAPNLCCVSRGSTRETNNAHLCSTHSLVNSTSRSISVNSKVYAANSVSLCASPPPSSFNIPP